MSKYAPLTPYNWPQDTLRVPNGQGIMPRINFNNGYMARREGALYTMPMTSFTVGQSVTTVIPIDADADFWCSSIVCRGLDTTGVFSSALELRLEITDIRTGYKIGYPYLRAGMFTEPLSTGNFAPSSFIQPYCFTRNGGIEVTATCDATVLSNDPTNFFLTFVGWKEYVYVAH